VPAWLDDAPRVLAALAGRWGLELGEAIPRGSVSVVLRACRGCTGGARLATLLDLAARA